MKLIAKDSKAQIKWFYFVDGKKYRMVKGLIGVNAWDATCSCGWESRVGGGVKSYLDQLVFEHKYIDHDYQVA
jgi:hypothetical protein